MSGIKYTVVKSRKQYNHYCSLLEALLESDRKGKEARDEVDLLTLLIETWNREHSTFKETDPVQFLHSLLEEHNMKAQDLVRQLRVSKGYVSDILNYKKGMSKEIIRDLAACFKVSQEAFNRPYKLKVNTTKRKRSLPAQAHT